MSVRDLGGLLEAKRAITLPVVTGEELYTKAEFQPSAPSASSAGRPTSEPDRIALGSGRRPRDASLAPGQDMGDPRAAADVARFRMPPGCIDLVTMQGAQQGIMH